MPSDSSVSRRLSSFEIQGHRGARGFLPENTLPSFELAIDLGVDAIETDVHLTKDGVPILCHEPMIEANLCRLMRPGPPPPEYKPLVSSMTLAELRCYRADVNPDPARFPRQQVFVTALAQLMSQAWGLDPYGMPTVAELFAFVAAYAGKPGKETDKTAGRRRRAGRIIFDLEIKRVPFYPEFIDGQDNPAPLLERRLIEEIHRAGVLGRCRVRSFDHRCLLAIKALEPTLQTAVLIADTAPVSAVDLTRQAGAEIYCPDYRFVDEDVIRQAHEGGIRVVPWTVNEQVDWDRLKAWGVDGVTTDYPG